VPAGGVPRPTSRKKEARPEEPSNDAVAGPGWLHTWCAGCGSFFADARYKTACTKTGLGVIGASDKKGQTKKSTKPPFQNPAPGPTRASGAGIRLTSGLLAEEIAGLSPSTWPNAWAPSTVSPIASWAHRGSYRDWCGSPPRFARPLSNRAPPCPRPANQAAATTGPEKLFLARTGWYGNRTDIWISLGCNTFPPSVQSGSLLRESIRGMVSRKWIATTPLVSVEETATRGHCDLREHALQIEGLLEPCLTEPNALDLQLMTPRRPDLALARQLQTGPAR